MMITTDFVMHGFQVGSEPAVIDFPGVADSFRCIDAETGFLLEQFNV